MNFTKNERVFDRSKVGVGDIIEFNEYSLIKGKVINKRVGIVVGVELDVLWIRTQDNYSAGSIEGFGIGVERADELRMVHRSPYNVKEGEQYGEPKS